MDNDDKLFTWGAWTGWVLLIVFVTSYFALSGPTVPDCCEMGMDTTCLCYGEAE